MQATILIILIVGYLLVCRQTYRYFTKGAAHNLRHRGVGLALLLTGILLAILVSAYVCYLMEPVSVLTATLIYFPGSAPFYGAWLFGLLGKKNRLADAARVPKEWQIGIVGSARPNEIMWQIDFVEAGTRDKAEALARGRGYYRNIRVREV